jgi:competence protein ComEA
VANPGIYSLKEGDTLQTLLSDAGIETDADLSHIELYVPREGEYQSPQKIDINRAEPWLLEALPGIGEVLAQRIVDYRSENGPFKIIEDLLKVSGIGEATFEKIEDYITVSD